MGFLGVVAFLVSVLSVIALSMLYSNDLQFLTILISLGLEQGGQKTYDLSWYRTTLNISALVGISYLALRTYYLNAIFNNAIKKVDVLKEHLACEKMELDKKNRAIRLLLARIVGVNTEKIDAMLPSLDEELVSTLETLEDGIADIERRVVPYDSREAVSRLQAFNERLAALQKRIDGQSDGDAAAAPSLTSVLEQARTVEKRALALGKRIEELKEIEGEDGTVYEYPSVYLEWLDEAVVDMERGCENPEELRDALSSLQTRANTLGEKITELETLLPRAHHADKTLRKLCERAEAFGEIEDEEGNEHPGVESFLDALSGALAEIEEEMGSNADEARERIPALRKQLDALTKKLRDAAGAAGAAS